MHQHRIFLCGVKVGREHVEAVDCIAAAAGEFVAAALAHSHPGKFFGAIVGHQRVLAFFGVQQPHAVGGGQALSGINQHRALPAYREVVEVLLLIGQTLAFCRLGVNAVEVHAVPVICREVDFAVVGAPLYLFYRRVELLGYGSHRLGGDIHYIKLVFRHIGNTPLGKHLPYVVKGLGAAHHGCLRAVGREYGRCDEAVFKGERVHRHCLKVHSEQSLQGCGALAQVVAVRGEQDVAAVGADVVDPGVAVAEGQTLLRFVGKVIFYQMETVAPAALTVVGHQNLVHFALLGPLRHHRIYGKVLRRGYCKAALGYVFRDYRALLRGGVHRHDAPAADAAFCKVEAVACGHPPFEFAGTQQQFAAERVKNLIAPLALAIVLDQIAADYVVFAAGAQAGIVAADPLGVDIQRENAALFVAQLQAAFGGQ